MKSSYILLSYFFSTTLIGALLLYLPAAWNGPDRLHFIDSLFTSASAVCVTGLITVDTSQYTLLGKSVIMILIQAGGLGIITFATLLLLIPGRRISFNNRSLIKNFYVEGIEYEPKKIIKSILLLTFFTEMIGALILFVRFHDLPQGGFTAVFHAISAFCNAGFSTFPNSLEEWNRDPLVMITVSLLVICGGISFVVLHDISARVRRAKPKLSLHSTVVLITTLILVLGGTIFFYISERHRAFEYLLPPQKILNAFFHVVTPRTAGFNALPMNSFSPKSNMFTMVLMFIGAAPGSMAGGIKVTTLFLVLLSLFRGIDKNGDSFFGHYRIPARVISHAGLFFIKALFLLSCVIFLLSLTERSLLENGHIGIFELVFEAISAFGTVGLSLGVTAKLSFLGKIIIIGTMLSGRIGLIFMATDRIKHCKVQMVEYPFGEVITG
ncbi:TrkH family potassium uptake protein [Oceanispirochaeta sp.]|jgi:trk system potassium uptake protein TrkH|uniref:TrkH family potassium uptake protein n=1 Tax=Oceanispirochaeta sp. TaxID=2035350 RepID=UPI002607AB9F|nr:TrkH family potassium uptake protein [Oceanispirochaeta sp.]MDA3957594.1 TrkH family potassium uptake protein [Oceanispirochaeta sp.]